MILDHKKEAFDASFLCLRVVFGYDGVYLAK